MKIEHLEERVNDFKKSIETVIAKKNLWDTTVKKLITKSLNKIVEKYAIGWHVQEINWMNTNKAVNITFDSYPLELNKKISQLNSFQFIQGGSLVFSQSYSGDIFIFILYPLSENTTEDITNNELGVFSPEKITEKLIVEKVDEFLKRIIEWEVPSIKNKVGF